MVLVQSVITTRRVPRVITFTPRHIRQILLTIAFLGFLSLYVCANYHQTPTPVLPNIPPKPLVVRVPHIDELAENGPRQLNIIYDLHPMDESTVFAKIETDRGPASISVFQKFEDPTSHSLLSGLSTGSGRNLTSIANLTNTLESIFACDFDIHLIDIGAGLGVLSTIAGRWQRKVIAVEACLDNVRKLRQTVATEELSTVTLLNNAVYDTSAIVQVLQSISNRSAAFLEIEMDETETLDPNNEFYYSNRINTIFLDDLLPIIRAINIQKAILRIDLDDSKYNALLESRGFFNHYVKVPYILMNWTWRHKNHDKKAMGVIKYLTSHGYYPYDSFLTPNLLYVKNRKFWPNEIVWFQDYETCSKWTDLQEVRKAYRLLYEAERDPRGGPETDPRGKEI